MKVSNEKPVIRQKKGDDLSISNAALQVLMREVLAKGAAFRFYAKGVSMSPFIKNGDAITIAPLSKEKPGIGKVVAFISPHNGKLVIHRIIGKNGPAYLIQGDNSKAKPDGLVRWSEILGCVKRVERSGKQIRLGTGCERYLLAFLSRIEALPLLVELIQRWRAPFHSSKK